MDYIIKFILVAGAIVGVAHLWVYVWPVNPLVCIGLIGYVIAGTGFGVHTVETWAD